MERKTGMGKLLLLVGIALLLPVPFMIHSAVAAPGKERPAFCTMQYDPVCAMVQVQCVRAPCPTIKRTFGNACLARMAGAKILYRGECGKKMRRGGAGKVACSRNLPPEKDPGCKAWTDGCNICQRGRPGARPFCTKMFCANRGKPQCLRRFGQ